MNPEEFTNPSEKTLKVISPGRINLIGEHTDYNNGFVLPAAIDKAAVVSISKRNDETVHLYATAFNESYKVDLYEVAPAPVHWANYVLGVVDQLLKAGHKLSGFDMQINGTVPIGAGLSSSAAVECAAVFALNELFQLNLNRTEMARIAQMAEHEFAGVKCGIMDMYASLMGKKDHVILLDCQSLAHTYYPLHLGEYTIVLMDTRVKHSLASTEYNLRKAECEKGIALVQLKYPQVQSLRDINTAMLKECVDTSSLTFKRCLYVIEENERVLSGCADLQNGDIKAFGEKMFLTHKGLSEAYEVSCPELDFLVDCAKADVNVIGSRMMGGGFGGCTINLVLKDKSAEFINKTTIEYQTKFKTIPQPIFVTIENGTALCS